MAVAKSNPEEQAPVFVPAEEAPAEAVVEVPVEAPVSGDQLADYAQWIDSVHAAAEADTTDPEAI